MGPEHIRRSLGSLILAVDSALAKGHSKADGDETLRESIGVQFAFVMQEVAETVTSLESEARLGRLGLEGYPKTSGSTGVHVYVPLEPVYEYSRVRRFVETVGRTIVGAAPDLATMEWDIPKRAGKVFIDHNQNVGGKTIASVYSVRPRPGAPVSTPLVWAEVGQVQPDDFTIATVWERLQRFGDLFAPVLKGGQTLDAAEAALGIDPPAS